MQLIDNMLIPSVIKLFQAQVVSSLYPGHLQISPDISRVLRRYPGDSLENGWRMAGEWLENVYIVNIVSRCNQLKYLCSHYMKMENVEFVYEKNVLSFLKSRSAISSQHNFHPSPQHHPESHDPSGSLSYLYFPLQPLCRIAGRLLRMGLTVTHTAFCVSY